MASPSAALAAKEAAVTQKMDQEGLDKYRSKGDIFIVTFCAVTSIPRVHIGLGLA